MLHALVLHLALLMPVPPYVGTGAPRSAPCTTGTCTFTWSGPANQAITDYNSGFANLSSSHGISSVTLDGAGHVQTTGYNVGGFRYTASSSDTAQIIFTAAPGADSNLTKGVCVRANGTSPGYCLQPCYGDGTGKWARLCTEKNGSEFQQGPLSSYDPTVDNTAAIVVSGSSPVTIQLYWNGTLIDTATDSTSPIVPGGNPGAYCDGGGDNAKQRFGRLDDFRH